MVCSWAVIGKFCRFGSLAQNDTPDPSKLEINKNVDEKYVENEEEEDYETDNDEGEEEEVKLRNKNLSVEMRALSASLSDLRAPRPRPISEIGPLRRPTKPRRRLLTASLTLAAVLSPNSRIAEIIKLPTSRARITK